MRLTDPQRSLLLYVKANGGAHDPKHSKSHEGDAVNKWASVYGYAPKAESSFAARAVKAGLLTCCQSVVSEYRVDWSVTALGELLLRGEQP